MRTSMEESVKEAGVQAPLKFVPAGVSVIFA